MNDKQTVLIIDDEQQIRRLLKLTLDGSGYHTLTAETAKEGIQSAATHSPVLIILDLGLPDMDGLEVLRRLREWCKIPILILSVRDNKNDIIAALDGGADDYLTKPFHTGELLARIRSVLRHKSINNKKQVECHFGDIVVDLAARIVKKNNDVVKLTATEYALLTLLIQNADKVLTHSYILEKIWGHANIEETQYTRIYIASLRKKLEDDPSRPQLIITESGIGYRLITQV